MFSQQSADGKPARPLSSVALVRSTDNHAIKYCVVGPSKSSQRRELGSTSPITGNGRRLSLLFLYPAAEYKQHLNTHIHTHAPLQSTPLLLLCHSRRHGRPAAQQLLSSYALPLLLVGEESRGVLARPVPAPEPVHVHPLHDPRGAQELAVVEAVNLTWICHISRIGQCVARSVDDFWFYSHQSHRQTNAPGRVRVDVRRHVRHQGRALDVEEPPVQWSNAIKKEGWELVCGMYMHLNMKTEAKGRVHTAASWCRSALA